MERSFHSGEGTEEVPEGNSWQRLAYSWPLSFPVLRFSVGHQPLLIVRESHEFCWCRIVIFVDILCKGFG
jgi:hypothetical protein